MTQKLFSFAHRKPFLFFAVYSLLLILDFLVLGERAIINSHDILRMPVPYLTTLTKLVAEHGPIGWFPSWGGGMPVLNSQFSWWRPENLLYFVFSPYWVYVTQYFIGTFVAGFGSYLFFSRVEGLSQPVGLIVGIIFTTAVTIFVPDATSLVGIPLFLYFFDRLVLSDSLHSTVLYALGCLYYILSANLIFIQPYSFLLHLTLLLRFRSSGRYTAKAIWLFLTLWGFYSLTQLPMVLNMLVLEYGTVGRAAIRLAAPVNFSFFTSLHEHHVLVTAVTLAGLVSIFRWKQGRFYAIWFLVLIPIRFLWGQMAETISFFRSFQCRVFEIGPFYTVAIFAFGLQHFFQKEGAKGFNKKFLLAITVSLIASLLHEPSPSNYFLTVASLFLTAILYMDFRSKPATVLTSMFFALALYRLAYKPFGIVTHSPNSFKFYYDLPAFRKIKELEAKSHELFRVASYGIPPGAAGYHGFHTADMAHSFYPVRYQRFWIQVLNVGERTNYEFLENTLLGNGPEHVELDIPREFDRAESIDFLSFNPELLALANVKYLVSRIQIEDPGRYGLKPIYEDSMLTCHSITSQVALLRCRVGKFLAGSGASLYRLVNTFPRAFIAGGAVIFDTDESLNRALRDSQAEELRRNVYLLREDLEGFSGALQASNKILETTVRVLYSPDCVKMETTLTQSGFLILTDNYSQRWRCVDNGKVTRILPAYHTFRAIPLEAGSHEVICEFQYLRNIFDTNSTISHLTDRRFYEPRGR